jgi:hypothetical protein
METAMFPNHPSYVEKLVRTKEAEIMREIQNGNRRDLQEQYDFHPEPKRGYKVRVLVGLLVMLGWLYSLIF